jgi:hypothetical protein
VTVRLRLPALFAALVLGLACSYAVACGESDEGLLRDTRAEGLKANLDDLDDAVTKGQCERAAAEIQNLREQIAALPRSTDDALRRRLQQGVDNLAQVAPEDCRDTQTETQTQTTETVPTTETTPPPTTATTPPPTTETTPPPTTETTPPPTETEPPPPEEVPPETPPGGEEAPGADAGAGAAGGDG